MTSGVYWFYQKSQDRCIYVGSSVNIEHRLSNHFTALKHKRHYNVILQRAWDKYGSSDIVTEVLEETPKNKTIEREQFWMDAMPVWPICNIAVVAGNSGIGHKASQETRQKMSEAHKGREGRPLTPETKQKLSAINKQMHAEGRINWNIGAVNKGAVRSKEFRENIRKHATGRLHTQEAKEKISASKRGKKRDPETVQKIKETKLEKKRQKEIDSGQQTLPA